MMLYTTLNDIKKYSPCEDGWKKLLTSIGKTKPDNEQLSFKVIIESNGFDDALWCLRALKDNDREVRLYAVWCARQVEHLDKSGVSKQTNDVSERFANGEATPEELDAARDSASNAARAAAWSAARDSAWSAAWDAVSNAARDSAMSAARDSASNAARDSASNAARAAASNAARDSEWAAAWDSAWSAAWDAVSNAARAEASNAARAEAMDDQKQEFIRRFCTGD